MKTFLLVVIIGIVVSAGYIVGKGVAGSYTWIVSVCAGFIAGALMHIRDILVEKKAWEEATKGLDEIRTALSGILKRKD